MTRKLSGAEPALALFGLFTAMFPASAQTIAHRPAPHFEQNIGQAGPVGDYLLRRPDARILLSAVGVRVQSSAGTLQIEFLNGAPAKATPSDRVANINSYLAGDAHSAASYRSLRYHGIYPVGGLQSARRPG